jgi:antitoxin HicB
MSKTQTFKIVLHPEPEGGFTVRVPELPEIVTFGNDESEAIVMAHEAIALALEHRLEHGEALSESGPVAIRELTVLLPTAA